MKPRLLTVYLISLAFFLSIVSFSEAGKDILSQAIESYHFVQLEEAIAQTQKAVKSLKNTKDRATAYFYMGASYIALGQTEKGVNAFQQAIRIAPEEAPDPKEFSPKIILAFKRAEKRMQGSLHITINKRGTEIFVGRKSYGRSTSDNEQMRINNLKPGDYTVRGKLKNYKSVVKSVVVTRNSQKKIYVKMKQGKTIAISTNPERAEIEINNKLEGHAPLIYPIKKNKMLKIVAFKEGYRKTMLVLKNPKKNKIKIQLIKKIAYALFEKGLNIEKSIGKLLFKFQKKKTPELASRLEQLLKQSLDFYTQAAEEDPNFSLALSAIGRIHLKKEEKDAVEGGLEPAASFGSILMARNFSQKALSLNNDQVAFSQALQNIGNCFLYEGDQKTNVEERVGLYKKSIEKFDEAITALKKAEFSPDYRNQDLGNTSYSRALAVEKIAQVSDTKTPELINSVCSAWEDFFFHEDFMSGETDGGLSLALHTQATEKIKKYCKK